MTNSIWRVTRDCILRLSEWVQPIKRKQTKQYADVPSKNCHSLSLYLPHLFLLRLSYSLIFAFILIFYLFATCKNSSSPKFAWVSISQSTHSTSVQHIYLRHKLYEQAIKISHKIPFLHQVSKNKQMIKMNNVLLLLLLFWDKKVTGKQNLRHDWGRAALALAGKNIYIYTHTQMRWVAMFW